MLLEGLFIPLTTPFFPDGRLNPHKLASNIARCSKTPAAGLIVLGPSGEPTLLSDAETREVLHTAAPAAAPEKVLIAGISRDSVLETVALAHFADESDYDAVLVGAPSILTAQSTLELLTYFRTVADQSPLRVILLSTGTAPISAGSIIDLATHSNILGLLASTAEPQPIEIAEILRRTTQIKREVIVTSTFTAVTSRMELAAEAASSFTPLIDAATLIGNPTALAERFPIVPPLRTRTKTVGFQVLAGNTPSMLDDLLAGAAGIAPAFAACAPQACYEVFAAWKDADPLLAAEKQARLNAPAQTAEISPGSLKHACDLNGYFGGMPRLPLLPPTGERRTELELLMKDIRN